MFTQTNTPYMRALRKGTAHAFSKNEIGRMNAIAARHVDTFLRERLVGLVGTGEAFDPCYEMNRITFYVICEAAMEYTPTDDDFESFCEHIEIALKEFTFRQSVNPLRGVLWTLLPGVREALASSKKVMDFTRKVLEAYQSNPHKSPQNTLIKLVNDNPACGDDNHLKTAELLGWITAGHDTTGYTLSNLLVLLAMHPNIQDKLRTAIKGQADPATVDYYKYVVKEASRLVPTAPMGSIRTTGRDFVVDAQTIIPKGAVVFLQQYVGNHSAAIFPSPEAFLPERWENPTLAMNEQMYPFSLGPRNCPGQALAVSEINATLPRLICAYRFELEEAGEMEFFLTLKYRGARIKPVKL
jgi:cytochrome P450